MQKSQLSRFELAHRSAVKWWRSQHKSKESYSTVDLISMKMVWEGLHVLLPWTCCNQGKCPSKQTGAQITHSVTRMHILKLYNTYQPQPTSHALLKNGVLVLPFLRDCSEDFMCHTKTTSQHNDAFLFEMHGFVRMNWVSRAGLWRQSWMRCWDWKR